MGHNIITLDSNCDHFGGRRGGLMITLDHKGRGGGHEEAKT